mgnify:CR=1 FL=1
MSSKTNIGSRFSSDFFTSKSKVLSTFSVSIILIPHFAYDLGALTMTIKLVDSYITPEIKEKTENYLNRLFK